MSTFLFIYLLCKSYQGTKLKAGMVFIAGKLCDPCLSALKWFVYHARRYTSARLYLLHKK